MKFIEQFLNYITMYRLVLYYLIVLLCIALILSFFHFLPFRPQELLFYTLYIVGVCWVVNTILAKLFHVATNIESVYISGCILALIITPNQITFATFAAIFTIASKYLIAIHKKHIFNPVALGILSSGFLTGHFASWWVGTSALLVPTLIGGYLVVRKIRREYMVATFLLVAIGTVMVFGLISHANPLTFFAKIFLETPIIFFASIMLTEPLTTPPVKKLQMIYGGLVGFLFTPQLHIGFFYTTPEISLLLGNIFSYIVSPQQRIMLKLKEKRQVASDIFDFIFTPGKKFSFQPGQYMEWTLAHTPFDSRGNRRYFTIASSPTEEDITLGVRLISGGSSFKHALSHLSKNACITAGQLAGDFTLPKEKNKKLVFIAGGIGITPFRSIIQYLLDEKEKRDIILLYSAKTINDFAYKELFDVAAQKLHIKVVYTITDQENIPSNWKGYFGRITADLISKEIPDFHERFFYLSGPNSMVESYEELLKKIGVHRNHIKKDYFPGFA